MDGHYKLTKVAGLEGAYNPKGVVIPFLAADVSKQPNNTYSIQTEQITTSGKPGLTAMALISFATYNTNRSLQLEDFLNKGFYNMDCSSNYDQILCDVTNALNKTETKHLNLNQAFVQKSLSDFSSALLSSAFEKVLNGYKYAS